MAIHYLPTKKIIINDIILEFGESRLSVRSKILVDFIEENQVFNFQSSPEAIHQRRDIYKNFAGADSFFFLGYDKKDLLLEVEVHQCDKIKVLSALFGFDDKLDDIALQLERYSPITKQNVGEYFFKELKIVIMDKRQMGGDGNTLGYFYCTSDIAHLD